MPREMVHRSRRSCNDQFEFPENVEFGLAQRRRDWNKLIFGLARLHEVGPRGLLRMFRGHHC